MKILLTTILIPLLVACSADHSGSHFGGIGSMIPEAPPTVSGPPGSGTITFPDGTKGYTTTDNGYFTVDEVESIPVTGLGSSPSTIGATLCSNTTGSALFEGVSADSNNVYLLLAVSSGSGVCHLNIMSQPLGQYTSAWTTVCSILDDAQFCAGPLRLDSNNFYVPGINQPSGGGVWCADNSGAPGLYQWKGYNEIRSFSRSTCKEGTALQVNLGSSGSSIGSNGFGVIGGNLVDFLATSGSASGNLLSFNTQSQTKSSSPVTSSLGGQSVSSVVRDGFITDGTTGWVLDGWSDFYLWKYSSWSSVAWGLLPASDYPGLTGCFDLAAPNSSTTILACGTGQPGLIYLGVSHF